MPQTLQALAEFTTSRLIGDGGIEVSRVASIAQAQPGDLVFVQTEDGKDLAKRSRRTPAPSSPASSPPPLPVPSRC